MTTVFTGLPEKQSTTPYDDTRRVVNNLLSGKLNTNYEINILPNTTETVIINQNVGNNSHVSFIGLDENSLTGNIFLKSRGSRTFTIGHDSADLTRKYSYLVIG